MASWLRFRLGGAAQCPAAQWLAYLMQELEDTHPPLSELSIYETASALANIAATARNAHEIAIKTSGLGRIVALINLQKRLDHADASEDEIAALASLIKVMWNLTDDPEIHDECFEQRVPLRAPERLRRDIANRLGTMLK